MIGQVKLKEKIDKALNRFPRFAIITGPKGSGKKTLCKEIVKKLNLKPLVIGIKIEDIRNAIDLAYTQFEPIVFIIADADNMSVAAKNSLLKVTEEPPKESYFLMTLQDIDNTLPTIRSRAATFSLDPYTSQEIISYREYRNYNNNFDELISKVCTCTGDVDEIFGYDVAKLYDFCKKVRDNIQIPQNGNTFKISKLIKVKDTDDGYSLELFLKIMRQLFFEKGFSIKDKRCILASLETSKTLKQMKYITVSKLGLLDMWIMNVRQVLRG